MNIPDEVMEAVTGIHPEDREYPDDVRRDFSEAAEWARKEALREAAEVAESDQFYDDRGDVLSSDEASYNTARREAASAIRALADGATS